MAESIYRKARKHAAKDNKKLNSADNAPEFIGIRKEKLLDIENEVTVPIPTDVVMMAKAYKAPELCSHYCSHECPIGKFLDYPEIDGLDFPEIAVSLMSAMHFFGKATDTVFSIFADREISENEIEDFKKVLKVLDELSDYSDALKLWAKQHGIV